MAYQEDNGPPLFTYATIATYLAVFAAQCVGAGGIDQLEAWPWLLGRGQTWRLMTQTLMHVSVLHLVFNLIMFFRFSLVIENWLGPWVALLLYVFFAAGSSAAQDLISSVAREGFSKYFVQTMGASGVVYGLFAFLWVMRRRRDDAALVANAQTSQAMFAWLAVCFVINLMGGHIGNTAHIVGGILGWMLGQAVVARRAHRIPIFAGAGALCGMLVVLTLQPVWQRTLAHVPVLRDRYYPHDPPAEVRESYEHPDRKHRTPGLF